MLSQQDDQCAQSRLVGEPLAKLDQSLGQWRACDVPFGRSSIRGRSTRVFKGGLTSQVWRPLHPGLLALAWLHDRASTLLHALRRMAVSRLEMLHFSLCKIARSEPPRGGVGTWRRQVQWKANPRCRRVRVEHESTRILTKGATARLNMPASHYSVG